MRTKMGFRRKPKSAVKTTAAQADQQPRSQINASSRKDGSSILEAMRSIVLLTAAAFGIALPDDAFARSEEVENAAQENLVRQNRNVDGFASGNEAKSRALMNGK